MFGRLPATFFVALLPARLFAQTAPAPANLLNPVGSNLESAYQVTYTSNLQLADAVVNIANAGSFAGTSAPATSNASGQMCANVYVYGANQQLLTCCSCSTAPNSLHSWPVGFGSQALLANASTKPSSVAIKILSTQPTVTTSGTAVSTTCDASFQKAPLSLVPGLAAWSTHAHVTTTPTAALTETLFDDTALSVGEALKLQNDCSSLSSGTPSAVCPSCSSGGLALPASAGPKLPL